MGFLNWLLGKQGGKPAKENRTDWSRQQYFQSIKNCLQAASKPRLDEPIAVYLRELGTDINDKFGISWMDEMWNEMMKLVGPDPCDALARSWEGISTWKKPNDEMAMVAELIFLGRQGDLQNDKRAISIGHLLHQLGEKVNGDGGGLQFMEFALSEMGDNQVETVGLERAWNGIGKWTLPPAAVVTGGDATAEDMQVQAQSASVDSDPHTGQKIKLVFREGRTKEFHLRAHVLRHLLRSIQKDDRDYCRQIGVELNDVGGFALMNCVHLIIYKNMDAGAATLIERTAWKGIGGWLG